MDFTEIAVLDALSNPPSILDLMDGIVFGAWLDVRFRLDAFPFARFGIGLKAMHAVQSLCTADRQDILDLKISRLI